MSGFHKRDPVGRFFILLSVSYLNFIRTLIFLYGFGVIFCKKGCILTICMLKCIRIVSDIMLCMSNLIIICNYN